MYACTSICKSSSLPRNTCYPSCNCWLRFPCLYIMTYGKWYWQNLVWKWLRSPLENAGMIKIWMRGDWRWSNEVWTLHDILQHVHLHLESVVCGTSYLFESLDNDREKNASLDAWNTGAEVLLYCTNVSWDCEKLLKSMRLKRKATMDQVYFSHLHVIDLWVSSIITGDTLCSLFYLNADSSKPAFVQKAICPLLTRIG